MTKPHTPVAGPGSRTLQRGGTFLGVVIGLVMGLGVALAVAVYVTKVPVPFINKGQSRTVEQDAAEAKKNKDWDPNAMIQGKNPVRSSSGSVSNAETAAKDDTKSDAKLEAKPDAKSDGKPEVKSAEAKSDVKSDAKSDQKTDPAKADAKKPAPVDPLGDLAKAKSSSGTADPFTYMVQTGAFRAPEDAESQRARLTIMGMDVKVSEREQSGRTVYRVRAGPFERKEDAEKTKEKLEAAGFETVLVRIQR